MIILSASMNPKANAKKMSGAIEFMIYINGFFVPWT
jgi:hypothetical protein